jgi:hypothetical protein
MKGKWILVIGLAIVVAAAGLAYSGTLATGLVQAGTLTEKRSEALSPAHVVTGFYDWYLDYARGGEELRNPLIDGAYRSSEYLAVAYIAEVDAYLASRERGGGDPFLLAQDIPEWFTVGETTVSGDRVDVALCLYWGGNPTPSHRLVHLERIDGECKIVGISIPER